jgi:hypothetical protein
MVTNRHDHDDGVEHIDHDVSVSEGQVVESRRGVWYGDIAGRVNAVIGIALLALLALLLTRFLLVAFGANPDSGFTDFILDLSRPFVRPFDNVFANRTWDEGVLEYNTLLAMGVYTIAGVLVMMLVGALLPRITGSDDVTTRRRITHA